MPVKIQDQIREFHRDSQFLRLSQRLLGVLILGLGIFVAISYVRESENLASTEISIAPDERLIPSAPSPKFKTPDRFPDLRRRLRQRNIFVDYRKESQRIRLAKTKTSQKETRSLDSVISLQGIIYKHQPVAVVQDTSNRETHFLGVGDRIQDAEIKEITAEKVIFSYGKRDVEFQL